MTVCAMTSKWSECVRARTLIVMESGEMRLNEETREGEETNDRNKSREQGVYATVLKKNAVRTFKICQIFSQKIVTYGESYEYVPFKFSRTSDEIANKII